MAGAIEAARILTQHRFPTSIVFAGLSGEEQGHRGGQQMAAVAREKGWQIDAVLDNDMIGNIAVTDGEINNTLFRVFSEPTPVSAHVPQEWNARVYGGEVDGPSRQIARFAARMTRLNAVVLAAMAWASPAPAQVRIGGSVRPSTTLSLAAVEDPNLAGYKVCWRLTTDSPWQWSRWVGDVARFTLENMVIDNYLFGVAAVGRDGNGSMVAFPMGLMR